MDDLLEHFIAEGRDLVQLASDDLLALEHAPDTARIDSAFRALHTLKGSAGLFDFAPLGIVLHATEDVMGALRAGRLAANGGIVTHLLDGIGVIDGWIEAIAGTGALPADAATVGRRLAAALHAAVAEQGAPSLAMKLATSAADPEWLAAVLARAPQVAATAAAERQSLVALRYRPDPGCFFRGDDPLAVVRSIPGLRMVHVGAGAPWQIERFDPFACNLIIDILSAAPLEEIRAAVRLVGDQIDWASVTGVPAAPAPGAAADAIEVIAAARSLRVDAARVDALADTVGELVVAKNSLAHLAAEAARTSPALARALNDHHAIFARLAGDLHRGVAGLRMVPLAQIFRRLPRVVRDTAGRLGKQVRLDVQGAETGADKAVVDALYEPLLHVLRNAVDHGIEDAPSRLSAGKPAVGRIVLQARREGDQVVITVEDDGAGIDPAKLRAAALRRGLMPDAAIVGLDDEAALDLIFTAGFSTAVAITDVSGRGVGLDAVRRSIEALGGRVSASSVPGRGATLRLALPLAVAVTTIVIVRVGEERFGVPLDAVIETMRLPRARILPVRDGAAFVLRDRTVPLLVLADLLDCRAGHPGDDVKLLTVAAGDQLIGMEVDGFAERIEVVLRPLSGLLSGLRGAHGTALLGDGSVLLVLNLPGLAA